MRGQMSSTLGGIQVCITMTNLLLGWIGEPAMTQVLLYALSPLGVILKPGDRRDDLDRDWLYHRDAGDGGGQ